MNTGMSDELTSFDQHAFIKVCGVGGGGGNAVSRMIEEGMKVSYETSGKGGEGGNGDGGDDDF